MPSSLRFLALVLAGPLAAALTALVVVPVACKSDPPVQGAGGQGGGGPGGGGEGGPSTGVAGTSGAAGSSAGGTNGGAAFTRAELLGAFGACSAGAAATFRTRAAGLDAEAASFAAAPDDTTRAAVRAAFKTAMDAWQLMETLQFGPTASGLVPGGQGFRSNIYAWPLFGRCAVEEAIVGRSYEAADLGAVLLSNRRGLGTLEYLLMYDGSDTACAATSATGTAWAALSEDERAARKRAYAAAVAHDLAKRAVALSDAWDPAQGNFSQILRTAGPGNATYPTTQDAFNSVSDAVFYLENVVKDEKLAVPAGIDMDACLATICPESLESQFGGLSKANLRVNLDGARRLLEGCGVDYSGLGFDDLLDAMGAGAVATQLRARAIDAQLALDAIEEPDLRDALAADRASVLALYQAIKGVTDVLKVDFVTVLDLRLPAETMGDND